MFLGEDDISFLISSGTDEGVNSLNLDSVKFLAGLADHVLAGTTVYNEHEGVVIFNGFDGAFGAQRVFDHGVLVPGALLDNALFPGNGGAGKSEGLGLTEGDFVPLFSLLFGVCTFLNSSSSRLCLNKQLSCKHYIPFWSFFK